MCPSKLHGQLNLLISGHEIIVKNFSASLYIVESGISNKMAEDIDPEELWDIDKYWNFEYYDYFDDGKPDPRGMRLAPHSGEFDD